MKTDLLLIATLSVAGCSTKPQHTKAPIPPAPPGLSASKLSTAKLAVLKPAAGATAPGQFISATQYGGTLSDAGLSVAGDASGNVFIGGTINGGGGVTHPFLAKRGGWTKDFGIGQSGSIQAIATDSGGNVLVTGSFLGTLDFGGGITLTSTFARYDIFVAKVTGAGDYVWSKQFGSAITFATGTGYGLAVDKRDNSVVITGIFDTPTDFGGGLFTPLYQDCFVAKFAANGAHVWSRQIGGAVITSTGYGLNIDTNGNVLLVGEAHRYGMAVRTVDFGGGPVPILSDSFLVKYTAANGYLWVKTFSGTRPNSGAAVTVDGGDAVMVGRYEGAITFGGPTLTNAPETPFFSPSSGFAARLTGANGSHVWSKKLGDGQASGIAVAPDGSLTVAGFMAPLGTLNLDANGNMLWSHAAGAKAVAVERNWLVTGSFSGTTDFGGGPITATGQSDIYAAEYFGGYGVTNSETKTNVGIQILGPFSIINQDGSTNQNEVIFVCKTTQLSNHVCRIESSPDTLFNFSNLAEWSCYPFEQPVGLFDIVPKNSPARFYRSLNIPCVYSPSAPMLAKAAVEKKPKALRYKDAKGKIQTVPQNDRSIIVTYADHERRAVE